MLDKRYEILKHAMKYVYNDDENDYTYCHEEIKYLKSYSDIDAAKNFYFECLSNEKTLYGENDNVIIIGAFPDFIDGEDSTTFALYSENKLLATTTYQMICDSEPNNIAFL